MLFMFMYRNFLNNVCLHFKFLSFTIKLVFKLLTNDAVETDFIMNNNNEFAYNIYSFKNECIIPTEPKFPFTENSQYKKI